MVALPTLDVLLDWANIAIWLGDGKFSRAALSMTFCLATNVVTWREERAAWLQEARGQEPDGVPAEAQPRWRDAMQLTGLGMALTAVDMVRAMRRGVLPTPAQRRHVLHLKLVEVSVEAGTQMVLQLCAARGPSGQFAVGCSLQAATRRRSTRIVLTEYAAWSRRATFNPGTPRSPTER